jgi:hypothetical protein
MRLFASFSVIISSLVLAACGGGSSTPEAPVVPIPPPVNTVPVAFDVSVKTNVDEPLDATLSAQDADGDALSYSITEFPTMGNVEILDAATGEFRFVPLAGAFGNDLFRYRVNDGTDNSAEATASIVVNRKPVAQDQSMRVATSLPAAGILAGSDDDGDPVTFVIVTPPANGAIENIDTSTGSFTYSAAENFEGLDSFTYQTNDGFADSPLATVTLSVNEWLGTVNLGTAADERVRYGLQIDDQLNLYVAYSTTGSLPGELSSGGQDVVLAMINKAGTVEWQKQWGYAGNESAYQMARHSDGSLYLIGTGYEDDGTLIDAYIVKFDENGDLLWELTYPLPDEIMQFYRLAISPNGNVYVNVIEPPQSTRRGRLMKITPDGVIEWTKVLGTITDDPLDPLLVGGPYDSYRVFPRGLAVDATETIYMTLGLNYTIAGTPSTTVMLASFDSDGAILSRVEPLVTSAFPINTNGPILRDIRVTPDANLRVLGDRLLPDDTWGLVTAELDTAGNEIWSTPRSVANENRHAWIGVLTPDGSSIVTGEVDTVISAGANIDAGVTKFDSAGSFVWESVLSGALTDGTTDVIENVGNPVTDANGSVFLLVSSNGGAIGSTPNQGGWDVFLVKLDGDTGEMIHP